MAKAEHFEIPADDPARAQRFYQEVLGYTYEPWGDDMGMLLQPDSQGINGDISRREGAFQHPTVVFTVDSIEQTVRKAAEQGGEQVGEIGYLDEEQTQRWVYLRDSEGNLIGLFDSVQPS
jgi:uncharacterized protein